MVDRVGELDLFLAVAKDCGIVLYLNQYNKASVRVLVSQPTTAYVGHIHWHPPVDITCGG